MTSAVITPVLGSAPTTEGTIYTVPANEDDSIDLILSNSTSTSISARVALFDGTNEAYAIYDKQISGNDTLVVYKGVKIPAGIQVRLRAGATGLYYSLTGAKRSTL